MGELEDLDLTNERPGPRADPTITSKTNIKGPGIQIDSEVAGPATGPAAIALSILIIAVAGTIAAIGVGCVTAVVGAAPVVLGAVVGGVFLVVVVPGLFLILRENGRLQRPLRRKGRDR